MSNIYFHSLEIVGRGTGTQLQGDTNLIVKMYRFNVFKGFCTRLDFLTCALSEEKI